LSLQQQIESFIIISNVLFQLHHVPLTESYPTRNSKKEKEIYLPRTITISNKKNTILKLARSRLPEKQKAIYAGRQHCSYSHINTEKGFCGKQTEPQAGTHVYASKILVSDKHIIQ